MQRTIKILMCIVAVFGGFSANGQQRGFPEFVKFSAPSITLKKSSEKKFVMPLTSTHLPHTEILQVNDQYIPADHYTRNFGFFCKEELQLQKRSGVNFSLRLGTLDYCNFLEGKTRAIVVRQ